MRDIEKYIYRRIDRKGETEEKRQRRRDRVPRGLMVKSA